jgi:hypothetical protein
MNPFSFGDDEFNLDDTVSAVCSVTKGDVPMKLWWTFKSDLEDHAYNLTTNDGVVITRNNQKVSMLTIEAVKARHRGNYTCHAQNRAGVTQQSSYLSINGSNLNYLSFTSLKSKSEFCNILNLIES